MDNEWGPSMWCGPNDGGIKRGDRAVTGDEEARPTEDVDEGGSGDGATADPSALATGPGAMSRDLDRAGIGDSGGIDDLTVHDAGDPELGLTDIDDRPPEDWAANTGPTRDTRRR
jgi:hypothetical protein